MSSTRIIVLISGNGTNLQALIDACQNNTIPNTQIVSVICNRKDAFGLKRAERAGISTYYHSFPKYKKDHPEEETEEQQKSGYDQVLAEKCLEQKPDLVVCAGWMRVLFPSFLLALDRAGVKIINLHPALAGKYPGSNAISSAFNDFQEGKVDKEGNEITKTGVMIHYVISEVDAGEPLLQREVEMREGETLEELEQRIHTVEWKAIVEGTNMAIEQLKSQRNRSHCTTGNKDGLTP